MTLFALETMIIGAMLGLRFKILVLAPAIVLSAASNLGIAIAHNSGAWSALLAMVLAIITLQVGYLGGTVGAIVIRDARVGKIAPETMPTVQKQVR